MVIIKSDTSNRPRLTYEDFLFWFRAIFEKIDAERKAVVVVFFRKELKLKTSLCLTPQRQEISLRPENLDVKVEM